MHGFLRAAAFGFVLLSLGEVSAVAESKTLLQKEVSASSAEHIMTLNEFYGLSEGMLIFEVGSGDGYFTNVLSHAVGPKGRIFAHYSKIGWRDAQRNFDQKYAGRDNIVPFIGDAVKFGIPDQSLDVVMVSLIWKEFSHDVSAQGDAQRGVAFLANGLRLLKPGGLLAIVEPDDFSHVSIEDVTSAGFEYIGRSRTMEKDGLTEHVALKFRKPAD